MNKRVMVRRSVVAGLVLALVVTLPAAAAVSRFLDVSDGSPFVNDIEWLADAGVTKGCGPDIFCPDGSVTREQMAAFLHRLSENEVVKAATAVSADIAESAEDANLLDGLDSTAFAPGSHNHDSAYLGITDQAADANLLDGLDSTAFAPGSHNHDSAYLGITDQAADANLLDGRAPASYDDFVIGDAQASGDQGGYLTICTVEQGLFCPLAAVSLEGRLLAEASFTTVAANSTIAVTGTTSLSSLATTNQFDTYVWLQLDSSTCTDVVNAAATGAYVRQSQSPGELESVSVTIAFEIPAAGNHSVALCGQPFAGNAGVLTSTISGVVSASPNNSTSATFYAP